LQDHQYELVAIGNTNVGKSSLLNELLGGEWLLNTSDMRETAFIWCMMYQSMTEGGISLSLD
jgi:GTP-binding protein EngB required for normal cell division